MARPKTMTTREIKPTNVSAQEYAASTFTPFYNQVIFGQVTYGTYQGSAGQLMPSVNTREV